MKNVSIYDGKRLAQPDEVANYRTGDGLEKAFLLANIIRQRKTGQEIKITVDNDEVRLQWQNRYRFVSKKGLRGETRVSCGGVVGVTR